MRSGRLRHRVRIEQKTKTTGAAGGTTHVWTLLDVLPADVVPDQEGFEEEAAKRTSNTRMHTITMRYRAGVTPSMRLVFGTRIIHIESVVNVEERNRELRIRGIETIGEVTS